MIRPLATLVAVLASAAALAACGDKKDTVGSGGSTQKLTVMLDFFPNADHAGLYAAKASGELRRAGISAKIETPSDPSAPLKLLAAGKVDLAISYEPEVLLARDKGQQLISVAAIAQRPLTSIIALGDAKVKTPGDLKGKTIGNAGISYQDAYLKTILKRSNVADGAVKTVNVGFGLIPAMLTHKVAATIGGFWNIEGVQLAKAGKKPVVIRVDRAGVPTYDELVLVARRKDLSAKGDLIRRFVQALGRGYAHVRDRPSSAVGPLVDANKDLKRDLQLPEIKASLPVFFPTGGKPFGYQSAESWEAFGRWMLRNGLVKRNPHAGNAITNEFLAGQGA